MCKRRIKTDVCTFMMSYSAFRHIVDYLGAKQIPLQVQVHWIFGSHKIKANVMQKCKRSQHPNVERSQTRICLRLPPIVLESSCTLLFVTELVCWMWGGSEVNSFARWINYWILNFPCHLCNLVSVNLTWAVLLLNTLHCLLSVPNRFSEFFCEPELILFEQVWKVVIITPVSVIIYSSGDNWCIMHPTSSAVIQFWHRIHNLHNVRMTESVPFPCWN